MKNFLVLCLLSVLISQTFAGNLSPRDAIKVCSKESEKKPYFTETGHLNTTYKIATIAGRPFDAKALAYFSQYPDEDKEFDAIRNAIKNKIPFISDDLSQAAVRKLHSLHGGDQDIILARRKSLELAIQRNLESSSNIWKAGLLIHAYGDTFAHTKGKFGSQDEKAFGPFSGHLFHSIFQDDPDNILVGDARVKYTAFVKDLFNVLKTNDADKNALQDYITKAENTNCKTDSCFKREVLGVQEFLGFSKFNSCMDANMKPLSNNQVLDVLNQIQ
ncbi:hypothetical protein [Acinetobacter modestus]|uniref:hypothetical protein n=1 Tax=Acinetobacter modestus TaxID=1776740 RepID=UPI001F4A4F6E|nr:hypothetical protein [Acinetobacter modestus]MCH7334690.1 hypothetical protein [Acinetobacter modestus]